ncbi:MAG: hypothetical protein R3C53_26315 [Pirellulaceae bacterium]
MKILPTLSHGVPIVVWRGLPAALVVVCSLAFVSYATFIQPDRLPPQYTRLLSEFQAKYEHADDIQEQFELGSSIDLCFQRLESMGSAVDEWQRAQFYDRHLKKLQAGSHLVTQSPDLSKQLKQQAAEFLAKRDQLFLEVANTGTSNFREANLWLVEQFFEETYHEETALRLTKAMQACLLNNDEDSECRIALTRLLIERAWYQGSRLLNLAADPALLAEALTQVNALSDSHHSERQQLQLQILVQVDVGTAVALANQITQADNDLAMLDLAACIRGEWQSVERKLRTLANTSPSANRQRLSQAAKDIGRLLHSSLPSIDSKWCTRCPEAMRLVQRLDPAAPELSSLIWQAAMQHAGKSDDLSPALVETLLIDQTHEFRFLILAISSAIRGDVDVATNYLQIASRSTASVVYTQIGYTALWYAQHDDAFTTAWIELLDRLSADEPNSGVLHLASGVMKFRQEKFSEAKSELLLAKALMGDVAGIGSLIEQCSFAEKRVGNE